MVDKVFKKKKNPKKYTKAAEFNKTFRSRVYLETQLM